MSKKTHFTETSSKTPGKTEVKPIPEKLYTEKRLIITIKRNALSGLEEYIKTECFRKNVRCEIEPLKGPMLVTLNGKNKPVRDVLANIQGQVYGNDGEVTVVEPDL